MQLVTIIVVVAFGWASQYDPGVMERVVANQQKWGRIHDGLRVDGYVAAADCSRIGEVVYLRPEFSATWEKFVVADCAGDEATRRWMHNIPYEVDGQTARRWGTVGRGIRIAVGKPTRERWRE